MSDFLKRLSRDPYAPIDAASITRVDELGNGYDDWGNLIAPKYTAPEQTWGETALGVATAPARLATALAGSLSPYGADGWQVPPIMSEGADALTAVGDAYTGKMAPEDINSRALGMAGFMMGGGGLAARPTIAAENTGARLSRSAFERSQPPIDEIYPTLDRLNRAVAEDDLRPRWAAAFPESPTWEEIQPDWWLNNRNMDNAASRQIGGDGDLWIAMNRAGNVTPNAGFSNDLAPMSNASDLPGISALKGAERLATPSGISLDYLDLLNSVGPGKSTLHANASKEGAAPALLDVLSNAYAPDNQLNMFGGRNAKTANLERLALAERMAAEGADRRAIWDQTGWFQGPDQKWRFEIDDGGLRQRKFDDELRGLPPIASDMAWKHDDLFKAYPESGDYPYYLSQSNIDGRSMDVTRGAFNPTSKQITQYGDAADKGNFLHEMQHGLQDVEGLAKGYNTREAAADVAEAKLKYSELKAQLDRINNAHGDEARVLISRAADGDIDAKRFVDEASKIWNAKLGQYSDENPYGVTQDQAVQFQLIEDDPVFQRIHSRSSDAWKLSNMDPYQLYKRHAGEVEARNVQKRMNMSADERRATPPWETQDIPDADQIVRMYANASKEASVPAILAEQEVAPARAYHGTNVDGISALNPNSWVAYDRGRAETYARSSAMRRREGDPHLYEVDLGNAKIARLDDVSDALPATGADQWLKDQGYAGLENFDGQVRLFDAPSFPIRQLYSNSDNSASAPAIAGALDMSQEARLARAREMGFDTDRILYHGTDAKFDQFNPSDRGALGPGVYFSQVPGVAQSYGSVGEFMTRGNIFNSRPFRDIPEGLADQTKALLTSDEARRWDRLWPTPRDMGGYTIGNADAETFREVLTRSVEPQRVPEIMKALGYDGIEGIADGHELAIFDPRNIRSVNAAFDPAKSDSANLLAANADSRPALLAYHGTNSDILGTLKDVTESVNSTTFGDVQTTRYGPFLSDNPEFSREYGSNVIPAEVRAKNVADVDAVRRDFVDSLDPFEQRDLWLSAKYAPNSWQMFEGERGKAFTDWLRSSGYDAARFFEEVPTQSGGYVEGNTIVPLQRGTVFRTDTGDQLYANSDSRAALLGAGQEQDDGYADGGRVGLPSPYSVAKSMIGQREGRGNDLLNRFLNGDTAGMTSAEYAWCSRFVKQAAAKAGVDVSKATDMARSWLDVGQPVDKPAVGDVVVLSRGNPNSQYGHVGFYEGTNPDGTIKILSGNHNNAVASGSYPASRVLGYRRLDGQTDEAYDPATGQQGLKPLAMMNGVGREVPALPTPTPEPSTQVAEQPKSSFDFTKLASLFAEPEQAQVPQINFTPIQAFQPQGSPIQASTPYRGTFAHGGQVRGLPDQSEPIHAGPLHSTVPGRTDHLPITVAAGSFVLPADIVSSLGEGNTNAGMEAVSEMFPLPPVRRADGGRVPIAAAGGEYVIAPETVAALGNGDMETGHELLDQFVRRTRAQNIQRLRALPGPEK